MQLSQKHFWETFKNIDYKCWFWILKTTVFLADIGYLVKLISNFEPKNLENSSNFEGWGLTLVAYEKNKCNI